FAALSSGISVPLSHISGVGWRGSLASWILLTGCAMVLWLPQMKNHHSLSSHAPISLRHSRVAWQITLFMGLQSLLFYVNVAWLPNLLHDRGMTLAGAGWMVSLMQFVSLPASFLMPIIAGRRKNQQSLVLLVGLLFGIGYLGLLLAGISTSWIWIVLIGMAGGASISLALAFFSLRSHTHSEAAQLSGMAQSIGYLLAALGPISIGLIHHATKNWAIPLAVLLAIVILMGLFGWGAGQDVYVNDGSQASLTA
ncbi:MAG: MFS transporter, partial [Sulfobacillus sp.]